MSTLVIDTITTDLITCNSGTCTGNIDTNGLNANSISVAGGITADSITANSGLFPVSLTAGSLNANSAGIAGALTAGSLDTNSIVTAGAITAGSISVNSASIVGALTTGSIDANSGAFATSLTVNGESVLTSSYIPPTRFYISNKPVKITNMPSALSLFGDSPAYVQKADLGQMNEVRFLVTQTTAGASNARIRANYSTSFGINPEDYSGVLSTTGPNGGVELDMSAGNAVHDSGWLALDPSAKASVYLGVVVSGGNGSADPELGTIVVEFR